VPAASSPAKNLPEQQACPSTQQQQSCQTQAKAIEADRHLSMPSSSLSISGFAIGGRL
jgi:hypothetical protein